jgi:hypothetical protein
MVFAFWILRHEMFYIHFQFSDKPFEYFLYSRSKKHAEYLFTLVPELVVVLSFDSQFVFLNCNIMFLKVGKPLSKRIGFDYTARDGLRIQAFLSLPLKVKRKNIQIIRDNSLEYHTQGTTDELCDIRGSRMYTLSFRHRWSLRRKSSANNAWSWRDWECSLGNQASEVVISLP